MRPSLEWRRKNGTNFGSFRDGNGLCNWRSLDRDGGYNASRVKR